jgi:DNA-binding Lrp family transcriptional regulator
MVPATPHDEPAFLGRLDDRVLELLHGLPGRIAFSGLRRSLGAHPESLARALRRLEREGLVDRSAAGYRALDLPVGTPIDPVGQLRQVAEIGIPPGLDDRLLLRRLTGRWFGSLRWMGIVERENDRLLAWAHRDGSGTVLLGARQGTIRLFATTTGPFVDEQESDDAAYELLVAVADALRESTGRLDGGAAPGPPRATFRAEARAGDAFARLWQNS